MIYKNIIDKFHLDSIGRIVFGIDGINESFNIEGDKMTIMVRNKKDDRISHHRSFKLKSGKISRKYKYGIPIIFDMKENNNGKISWIWEVDPKADIDKRDLKNFIGDKEKEFINAALKYAGLDMIEYWSLDYKNKDEQRRIDELNYKYNNKGKIL